MMNSLKEIKVDQLEVKVYRYREDMGEAAASFTVGLIHKLLKQKETMRMIFAAAPSQNEFLSYLSQDPTIDWSRIHAFHMDEYIGLPSDHPAKFSNYLKDHLFDKVPFGKVHLLDTEFDSVEECARYGQLLKESPIDIVCLGIGENGHIAFNDPGVADFQDPQDVKIVELDEACRMQQVHDGCFPNLEAVPTQAVTLTIPTLFSAKHLVCIVPGEKKQDAVHRTLSKAINEDCPATILRKHPSAILFVDQDAFRGEEG